MFHNIRSCINIIYCKNTKANKYCSTCFSENINIECCYKKTIVSKSFKTRCDIIIKIPVNNDTNVEVYRCNTQMNKTILFKPNYIRPGSFVNHFISESINKLINNCNINPDDYILNGLHNGDDIQFGITGTIQYMEPIIERSRNKFGKEVIKYTNVTETPEQCLLHEIMEELFCKINNNNLIKSNKQTPYKCSYSNVKYVNLIEKILINNHQSMSYFHIDLNMIDDTFKQLTNNEIELLIKNENIRKEAIKIRKKNKDFEIYKYDDDRSQKICIILSGNLEYFKQYLLPFSSSELIGYDLIKLKDINTIFESNNRFKTYVNNVSLI